MTAAGGRSPRRFGTHLMLVMILITLPVIGLISALDYRQVAESLIAEEDRFREQTERGVIQSICLVDAGLTLFDCTLDGQMEEAFIPVLAEYRRAGGDPGEMDLARVKAQLGDEVDVYIINESGVIEYTTYPPDAGLDFKSIPYFYDRITEIRLGDTFTADRVVAEPASGRLRKYAYMPSPDRRYLFELGLVCSPVGMDRFEPKYQAIREDLMRLNPALEEIRIFDCYGRSVNATDSESPVDPTVVDIVARGVYEEKQDRTIADPGAGRIVRYLFVDLSAAGSPSDASRVVALTYTTALLDARLRGICLAHVLLALFAGLAACCIAVPVSRQVTRPVQEIVDDVNTIAQGDLDHRIRVSAGTEFTRLEESISAMVDSLKENIRRLRASEETARDYSTRLEERVRERTADLEESNRAATLFLDIMVHDINNANTVAIGYTRFLVDVLEGERREMAEKMLSRLERSSAIIGSVATHREALESENALKRVDLDRVIRAEIANHPTSRIRYEGRSIGVLADDLLSEVFANLIGNAVKFGDPAAEIAVMVEDRGEEVLVSVEDTGPGIPDEKKQRLFTRFGGGDSAMSGLGLGLYICRMLIEHYGGKIRADDRVEDRPEEGAAIRFSLRKAPGE
ncbi:Signal transduction histidine-protein kinase BarA [Methanoculleus chikugoensis]|jgi:two-component system sensor histidine kinase BarA|uniref:histidine kinase n=1 Tax=Methanoculleus chikugoensis TaxID=118126 RepID=A0A1M4MJA3_9EURY|nr:HAMP domain-containing sensor histidine kinase [Methanoculleus chikugoensis]MDD4566858.1 HAMP domain-containing sensor histidine kinase [Methanoculleus chikugoensis]SCL74963.1 Signal transduction histidine-protein kinase BarA [Methanoculleus chikugoensis]